MIPIDPKYQFGDQVVMRNDLQRQPGIVAAYKLMPGMVLQYLVVWNPGLSSWADDIEIRKFDPTDAFKFGVPPN